MSQRMFIGENNSELDDSYDCIISELAGAEEKIRAQFLLMEEGCGFFIGPWKIRISDIDLFTALNPVLQSIFADVGKEYPICVWEFYYNNKSISHPTYDELYTWINQIKESK